VRRNNQPSADDPQADEAEIFRGVRFSTLSAHAQGVQTPESPSESAHPTPGEPAAAERREVRLDSALQARLLEQMREEQAAALRKRELTTWVLLPVALVSMVIGVVLAFSDDLVIATLANIFATGIGWVLWRINRERLRGMFGK
jgi:Flp pilus assembly protein TadB